MGGAVSPVLAIETVALRIGLDKEIHQAHSILVANLLLGLRPLEAVPIVTKIPREIITLRRLTARFPLAVALLSILMAPQPLVHTHRNSPTKLILVSIVMVLVQRVVVITPQDLMVTALQLLRHTRWIWLTRLILV